PAVAKLAAGTAAVGIVAGGVVAVEPHFVSGSHRPIATAAAPAAKPKPRAHAAATATGPKTTKRKAAPVRATRVAPPKAVRSAPPAAHEASLSEPVRIFHSRKPIKRAAIANPSAKPNPNRKANSKRKPTPKPTPKPSPVAGTAVQVHASEPTPVQQQAP